MSDREVQAIIERVRALYGSPDAPRPPLPPSSPPRVGPDDDATRLPGVHAGVDDAVEAAHAAFVAYAGTGLDVRRRVVAAIRRVMHEHAVDLAKKAHAETGIGRAEDKVIKNRLVIDKTPGPEELEPEVQTGDEGMTVTEFAPFGVIASITPTTNPTSTIINNTIAMLSAGNAVVFNVHPAARRVSLENVALLNEAIVGAGGPQDLVTAIADPTIESAQRVMRHPRVRLLLVTGGPAVVREALQTDKRAITAGPGNPPVVVDETADIALAGREIVRGASFDNNVICTDEKEVLVVASRADELLRAMAANGAVVLKEYQLRQLERVIFEEIREGRRSSRIDRRWVGKNAGRILAEIGISAGDDLRLAVADVPVDHPLVWTEQMMPILPVARVRSVDEAIDLAVAVEHGYRHTASIFSNDVATITRMARAMNCSIFVANGPTLAGLGAGGEDFTSFSIATPTGEGLSRPRTFSRLRRLAVVGALRIV